jgi:nucleotide-binding universal stress UspA family protein
MSTSAGGESRQRIVVGVDGSEESRGALRWAAEEATLRDAELEAVLAWEQPLRWLYGPPGTAFVPPVSSLLEPKHIERRAEETLAGAVQDTFGDQQPATLKQLVIEGNPAAVLVAQSIDATMLVLAAHGQGVLKGVDLGSTAEKCLRLARCNVVVIRLTK